nr:histidinol-phosphatase family [Candidatus Cloacimonadota bacterium]
MIYDYHIHTQYSYDSLIKADELIEKAIKLGYEAIAITEHLDLLPQEVSIFGVISLKQYVEYCQYLREKYPQITLHTGIEIGDYQLMPTYISAIISHYDFFPILGSVHFLSDHTNVAISMPHALNKDQITDYYLSNLKLVQECDIDVLAHLGVYKRYYNIPPEEDHVKNLIKEIFTVIIERGIALEINLSGLHKPYHEIIPEPKYIELYKDLGGKLFSLGSDSHLLENFGTAHLIAKEYGIPIDPPQKSQFTR